MNRLGISLDLVQKNMVLFVGLAHYGYRCKVGVFEKGLPKVWDRDLAAHVSRPWKRIITIILCQCESNQIS